MERIYYPDLKQKKECMAKLVKKAPEYKGIKIKIWILAVLCPIVGIAISVHLLFFTDYWKMVNEGPGNLYTYIAGILMVICPLCSITVWKKRFYKCCFDIYMRKEKYFGQTEKEIKFIYHVFDDYDASCGNEQEQSRNTMIETTYPYEAIRKVHYEPATQILEITGIAKVERYWDYELKNIDEGFEWEMNDDSKAEYLLCFDERNQFLDYLYDKVKDAVKEPIEVTWNRSV